MKSAMENFLKVKDSRFILSTLLILAIFSMKLNGVMEA